MQRTTTLVAVALLAMPVVAQDPGTPDARVAALLEEYNEASAQWMKDYRAASKEERAKILERRPNPDDFVPRFIELADEFETIDQDGAHEAAAKALAWIAKTARKPSLKDTALDRLRTSHLESPELTAVAQSMNKYSFSPTMAKFLATVLDSSPHADARGRACYALAAVLGGMLRGADALAKGDDDLRDQYIQRYGEATVAHLESLDATATEATIGDLLERTGKEFATLSHYRGDLGKAAEADLYELRHLGIGKVAPDIAGEDLDGASFKLSDYRGKVILLDFWGDW